ncbi:hypothetical protein GCU56_21460 [Geodermatophilus sabuli]|uniref:Uncharacterized protein n=1 Tax=Geodermatophilus sabuli TaxID=1564158 RepID=A0A7K3W6E6_9ACTN|nr:hypothetical protein [Geodermatophilus sabuli]NEK60429.1 hypothetical protein [Geodermatophilus sabuli]
MDAELAALASSAGTTLINALTTDAWERAKALLAKFFSTDTAIETSAVSEIVDVRDDLMSIELDGREKVAQEYAIEWGARIRRQLNRNPQLADTLRAMVEDLNKASAGSIQGDNINMTANAASDGRVYQQGKGVQYNS